jgi:hypothetical protein
MGGYPYSLKVQHCIAGAWKYLGDLCYKAGFNIPSGMLIASSHSLVGMHVQISF